MLILGRRVGDAILIDGDIRVVVLACDKQGVKLGIEAPSTVRILRGEIATRVAEENQRAQATAAALDAFGALLGADPTADTRAA
ncbi:MAG: carbon storage regulator CsrA [Gemmatimonadaceae bacterium]|jgi:carbon storage regulator|nr:carbon storage regulator CsrA [Gemmatimonadaceae bacterium]